MRRFKLWGRENAMVEDPEGEFVLWADIAPIIEKDRTQESDVSLAIVKERDRYSAALTRIRTEDLSRFDCTLIAAEAQGLIS